MKIAYYSCMNADGNPVCGRLAVILSALGFWALWTRLSSMSHGANKAIFGGLIILSCVEKAASIANVVSVERDWVCCIATRTAHS